ncbi:MAG: radical SAM family heme chaperone HemW [Bergeyella sp.]|nr:radical SAM family heme chaperone HemW [Bergeyella sp.]
MIYIHIPFCKQKCTYCNFHFSTSLVQKAEMLGAITREIDLRKNELDHNKNILSIYFGGGTPSVLSANELGRIIEKINKHFSLEENAEITLEINPENINSRYIQDITDIGVNRLSIGIQSFWDPDLKITNRAHNAKQAEFSIKSVQDKGIKNVSIDIIYGFPHSDFEIWKENLRKAVFYGVTHISSYALTVEPNTALAFQIDKKIHDVASESLQNRYFYFMVDYLQDNGFDHYEISNFGKPNFYSRHNTSYWKNLPYLGIGPAAHSYDGKKTRSWNIQNNAKYIQSIQREILPIEREILSDTERYNEKIMTGLRTKWGVDIQEISTLFSEEIFDNFNKNMHIKLKEKQLIIENTQLKIPKEKWFFADRIASGLFVV